jgi:LPXTG-motif cell wall-anchored protein
MYDPKTAVLATKLSAGTGLAALPHTGAYGVAWFLVAGFTLVMAGIAVLALVPRKTA